MIAAFLTALLVFVVPPLIIVAYVSGVRYEARRRDAGRGSEVVHVSDRFEEDTGVGDWPDTVTFDKAAEDAIPVTREWRRP